MTTDKERVIYVTFIPVPRIIYVLNNLVNLFIINGILFACEAFQTVFIWAYWSLHVDELLSPMFVDFKFITLKIQVRDYLNPLNLMKQLCSMKLKKLFGRTFSQNATTLIACLIQFMLWPAEQAQFWRASAQYFLNENYGRRLWFNGSGRLGRVKKLYLGGRGQN